MTNKNTKNIKRRGRARTGIMGFPRVPTGATSYFGPLNVARGDSAIITLYDNASVSSDITGTIAGRFNNNPSACRNWSEMSTSWGEYRVLGVVYNYMPIFSANTTAIQGFSGYHSVVHGTPTVPTTLSQAASDGNSRIWNPFRPFRREWRMSDITESQFILCSSPTLTSNCLDVLGLNASVSLVYGNIVIQYVVQFRVHNL
jgi:hypothetical protein